MMKKYMVIYHMPEELLWGTANESPEEMEKGMKDWMAWAEKCGDRLIDFGTPLAGGQRLAQDGRHQDSKRQVCGYSILQAESMEEAMGLLKEHPHLTWNGSCEIEVHESMPTPGM
jgi:hypothetical protein